MRFPRIVSLYIAREVLLYSLVGLAAVSLVFIGRNLLGRLAAFLMIGVAFSDVLEITRCVVIVTLAYTVPISFLFGALVGIGRLASDLEIKALRSCGVSLANVVLPVFVLGFLVSCLTWYIALDVEHRTKRELRTLLLQLTRAGRLIEPGKFTHVKSRMFFVENRDRENRLEGVFISDESDPERPLLIFAEHGEFSYDPEEQKVRLRLRNGDLHWEEQGDSRGDHNRMSFLEFEYAFDYKIATEMYSHMIRPRDMTMEELREVLAKARAGRSLKDLYSKKVQDYEIQIHRRFSLPVAPMVFALLAVPLALQRRRGARSWGVLLCGLLVTLYYAVLSFGQYLALEGLVPPAVALWLPNVFFGLVAVAFLVRASRHRE
jgi:lipopolysaccharide export system permease protein